MTANEELEKFRENWRAELSSKSDSDSTRNEQNNKPFHPAFRDANVVFESKTSTSVSYQSSDNDEKKTLDFSNDSNSKTLTYYPFNIVGNLLRSSSKSHTKDISNLNKNTGELVKSTSCKSESPCSTEKCESFSMKRKLKTDHFQKKEKKAKLKYLFSLKDRHVRESKERILDKFISDLDEINTIPFFELSIPREIAINIFKHLEVKDLGRCCQVSKSWKSLAEDELLWCNICHKLGFDEDSTAIEREGWKEIVQRYVERRNTLHLNWKERKGKVQSLQYDHRGIICSVNSVDDIVVAGYTTGEVKMWDLSEGDECIFKPSTTGLTVDLAVEWGTTSNTLENVYVSKSTIAASYKHGNVDMWMPSGNSTSVAQTLSHSTYNTRHVCLSQSSPLDTLITGAGPYIQIYYRERKDNLYQQKAVLDANQMINQLHLLEPTHGLPVAVITLNTRVVIHKIQEHYPSVISDTITNSEPLIELHNMIDYDVMCTDVSDTSSQVAVGLFDKIKLYDVMSQKEAGTFLGHTHCVTCINLRDSPEDRFVTGSHDRRVRVYDTRIEQPAITFSGSTSYITTVQIDDWKVVSGNAGGFVCVWDQRMSTKLWEMHNRHPVGHCKFYGHRLVVGNIPIEKTPVVDEFETSYYRRQRGEIQLYDFSTNQLTEGVPEICLSSYDQPLASNYNISLAVPYDKL
ncbi:hypothetical protein FSP39_004459 [Pinctada imbricata]|uniref:F-box domain-containing protein n=1 Tax=Pinctada imbricata TaxID=66713 RepID=A0AA88XEM6_PINIB|nr:hypothetical protein FSP39_004459 [Pinctada imbricata]